MQTILIANPKGGSGKTTLSTNVAGYLASTGRHVAMLDLDRQKSANLWLAQRDSSLPIIWPMQDERKNVEKADVMVIDSPAGLHGKNLDHAIKLVEKIIVPIAPSLFDIQASYDFLQVLSAVKAARKGHVQIGVVGMRMAPRTRAAVTLEQFLEQLDLPVLAYLREAQVYVNAAFEGKSIFDVAPHLAEQDLEQWADLIKWLEQP
ncbi:MAG: chromosome partitioning [Gallionellaceae bacterium]|nr:MAG: chromosome partitioning [Gallionellaceae bacterium]